jgi:DNA invertase Pin-like site-specific DNA recombinase
MAGSNVGYIRVSSLSQNTDRQLDGVHLDKVFTEKVSGGSTDKRVELQNCIDWVRDGDTLFVHDISRLARNLEDLQVLVKKLNAKGVTVKFQKEGLTFEGGKDNPMNTLMLQIIGAIAQFEKSLINERQAEGIAKALQKGVKFGVDKKLNGDQIKSIKAQIEAGASVTALAKTYSVSRQTIYRMIR